MSGRILHVIPSVAYRHGGPSFAIRAIEQALQKTAWHCETATIEDLDDIEKGNSEQAQRHYFRRTTTLYSISLPFLWWVRRHVREYDVIHIHALFSFMSVAAALAAKWAGVPYVIRPLGVLNAYGLNGRKRLAKSISLAILEKPLLAHASAVHFTSELEAAEASRLGIVLRHFICPLAIVPAPHAVEHRFPKQRESSTTTVRVLFLSRLVPKKNIEALIDALAILVERGKAFHLDVAGSGESAYVECLKERAQAIGVLEQITWWGHVAGVEKEHLLHSADVFALPSHSENFGIAVLEAMAAGIPCVVGRGVGVAVAMEAAGAGLAVNPTATDVATALLRFLDNPELRQSTGVAGRRLVESTFSLQQLGDRLGALYASIRSENPLESAAS